MRNPRGGDQERSFDPNCLNVSVQFSLPDWVRARGLAVFVTVIFGAMTLGSVIWGQVAEAFGVPIAL